MFQQSMSVWGNVHHHFEWLHLRMLSIFHRPTVRDSSRYVVLYIGENYYNSACVHPPSPQEKSENFPEERGGGGEGSVHRLLQLSLERNHLHSNAFVELYTTRKN